MKVVLLLLLFCSSVLSYADVSDKIHFEDIVKNPEKLKQQLYCYLDRGPCDEVAATHKGHILEAVHTACAKCTPVHKHNVRVFIKAVKQLFPDLDKEFEKKYDPDGKHYKLITDEVQKY